MALPTVECQLWQEGRSRAGSHAAASLGCVDDSNLAPERDTGGVVQG